MIGLLVSSLTGDGELEAALENTLIEEIEELRRRKEIPKKSEEQEDAGTRESIGLALTSSRSPPPHGCPALRKWSQSRQQGRSTRTNWQNNWDQGSC